jgi:Ni,Fe-hydrogenase III large subunit
MVTRELLLGEEFANIPVTILSFDPCFSCTER